MISQSAALAAQFHPALIALEEHGHVPLVASITTNYLYDNDDRLTDIQFPSNTAQNTHFTYDYAGRMLTVTDGSGGRTFTLEPAKRIGSESVTIGGNANALNFSYNSDQTVLSVQTPAATTSFTYDGDGRIQTVSDGAGNTTTYTYDHAGRMTGQSSATSGSKTIAAAFTWGVSGQTGDPSTAPAYLSRIYQSISGSGFQTYNLVNSYLGQILSQSGADHNGNMDTETYGYDARGRLSGENLSYVDTSHNTHALTGSYGYDLSGNLMAGSGWTYNTSNQLTAAPAEPGLAGATSLVYDNSGDVLSLSGVSLGYDVWGNMTSVGSATYTYDSSGRRVSKTVGGVTTYYLYDGDLLMAEENSSGVVTHSYTWGPTGLISDRVGGVTRFFLYDAQGNTRALVDINGTVLGRAAYTSWGSVLYSTLPSNVPFGWQGAEGAYTDPESGFVYLHNRYYAPAIGRFLTRDPSGFAGGINLYAYCSDDPIGHRDPLGLDDGSYILPEGNGDYSMRSFHPGMKAGTAQSNLANQMLDSLNDTLKNAAFNTACGGLGMLGDEAVAAADAERAREEAQEMACLNGTGCFLAGTMVQTDHGMVPIEKIKEGDKVYTRPESTDAKASVTRLAATTEVKPVLSTSSHKVDRVLHIQLANASGKLVDTLTVTRNHPFFVDGKGFVPAGGLAVGNAIVTRAGPSLTVKSIQWERSAQGYTVYNFVVQDDHTYFVGNGQEWVHNANGVCAYQVGTYRALDNASLANDGLQLHHLPQFRLASDLRIPLPGYTYGDAPAIALPNAEHSLISAAQIRNRAVRNGMTGPELFADDLAMLQQFTNAPASAIQELRNLAARFGL